MMIVRVDMLYGCSLRVNIIRLSMTAYIIVVTISIHIIIGIR